LLSIVNEVLDYNKINSGEFKIHPQVFNMMDVLQEVRTAIQPLATNKSLDLSTDFELDEHLTAYGDAFRLKQILFNLLGNAIKFTSKGSVTLKVAYKSYKNHLHFSFLIKDTGIGMNEKDLAHIFNEFEQAENTQHYINNQAGTGLGLSIVKRLVEKQLGRVSAKSKPGQGTTFSVFLKFEKVEATENKIKINQQIQLPDQLKIWIVDDDRFILDLCEMIFNNHHIAFESFNNASEILSAQPNPQLSHVLVDMRLPDKSGLEVCQILKEKLPAHIEFYAITAHVLKEEQENILTQGFKGIIMKPFKEQELLDIFINTTHDLKVPRFDFTALRKMTFDDEKQLKKIWLRFKQDCEDDSKQLQKSIMEEDVATARLVVHRLAGRLSQIGAKEIGNELRKKEIRIEQENELSDETKSAIKILMDHVYQLTLHEPV
ncbi:MAG: ATP-binding protein, partial [Pelobium sp.]